MEKSTQPIELCRSKAQQILNLLSLQDQDITDYTTTLRILIAILEKFSREKIEVTRLDLLQSIHSNLTLFENKLISLKKTGRIMRFFTNNRLRRNLDRINSDIGFQIGEIEKELSSHQRIVVQQTVRGQHSNIMKADQEKLLQGISPSQKQAVEDRMQKFHQLWEELFGGERTAVSWKEFATAMRTKMDMSGYAETIIKEIIDDSNSDVVQFYKFLEFLKGFGPLENCIDNAIKIFNEPWFYGYMSKEEARRFLEMGELGTFLVRFSASQPGSFAISYVGLNVLNKGEDEYKEMPSPNQMEKLKVFEERSVLTVLVDSTGGGFRIRENKQRKEYKTLHDVISYYNLILTKPFESTLPREPWFWGDITAEEAHEILEGEKVGTFLIRFSSKPECFASSFVGPDGTVGKSLISKVGKGYLVEQSTDLKRYRTIQDLVYAYQSLGIFKYPYQNRERRKGSTTAGPKEYLPFPTNKLLS